MKIISIFICSFFLLLVPILSFAQFAPPTWINDGPGEDVDYWTNASSFQANWAEVTFPTGGLINNWRYSWRITYDDNLFATGISQMEQVIPQKHYPLPYPPNLPRILPIELRYAPNIMLLQSQYHQVG